MSKREREIDVDMLREDEVPVPMFFCNDRELTALYREVMKKYRKLFVELAQHEQYGHPSIEMIVANSSFQELSDLDDFIAIETHYLMVQLEDATAFYNRINGKQDEEEHFRTWQNMNVRAPRVISTLPPLDAPACLRVPQFREAERRFRLNFQQKLDLMNNLNSLSNALEPVANAIANAKLEASLH